MNPLKIKADSPILDLNANTAVVLSKPQQDVLTPAVTACVAHQFPHSPEQCGLQVRPEFTHSLVIAELDSGTTLHLALGNQPIHRASKVRCVGSLPYPNLSCNDSLVVIALCKFFLTLLLAGLSIEH